MLEEGILLGGELSGHMFVFEDYFPFDDALFAASKLLQYLSRSHQSVSEHLAGLPKLFSTRLIEVPVPDEVKFEVANQVALRFAQKYVVNNIDGARIDFDDGWAIVRASNTTPNLTIRFEANSQEALDRIRGEVFDALREFPEVSVDARAEH
jgi:phosphomannomutase / phosphoglucomutase